MVNTKIAALVLTIAELDESSRQAFVEGLFGAFDEKERFRLFQWGLPLCLSQDQMEQGGKVDGRAVQAGYEQDPQKDSLCSRHLLQDQPKDAAVPHKDGTEGQTEGSCEKAPTPGEVRGFEGGGKNITSSSAVWRVWCSLVVQWFSALCLCLGLKGQFQCMLQMKEPPGD